jgi:ribosomal protein L7Ae-like RNA K-turn-binding protein
MDKALNILSLARKAGLCELGEEPVGAATRALHARLVLVASDASDHTWRRAKSFVAGTDQQCIRVSYTKDELGMAIGRQELAIAAITDPGMALSLVDGLGQPEKYRDVIQILTEKKKMAIQRQKEAKAHTRNARFGKKK